MPQTLSLASELPETLLAGFAASTGIDAIPEEVRHEAKRSLLNIVATTLAGCREPAVEIALGVLAPFSAEGNCTLVGRNQQADAALAAFVNAMSANIFDFDDTHEATVIHPAATVFAASLAQAEAEPVNGRDFLTAFAIGCEVECRLGNAVSPGHYARGFHITSTCGIFGAAAACGVLMGLDPARMLQTLSTATTQSSGLVETLGTMAKSAGIGAAARGGLISAHLARGGMTGPAAPFSGRHGWLRVYGESPRAEALTDRLGDHWEMGLNTYKPYPVGVVLNPVIDACLQLRATHRLSLDEVAEIEITGHPLLRQRTDRPYVTSGREAQVSAQHAVAVTLSRGNPGLDDFTDAAAAATARAGRPTIAFRDDPDGDIARISMTVHRRRGAPVSCGITAASGSTGNPLSDKQIEEKLFSLSERAGLGSKAVKISEAIWTLEGCPDMREIARAIAG